MTVSLNDSKQWEVAPEPYGTITLNTSGKYLDRDIIVESIVTSVDLANCTVAGGELSGGDLYISSNYSKTPTVTLSSGSDTNISNVTIGTLDKTNYPYYFKVSGASSALSGTTTVVRNMIKRAEITDTHTAGYLNSKSTTTVISSDSIASDSISPTVTVNAGSGSTYINLKKAAGSVIMNAGSGSIIGSNVTLTDTDNGISVTGSGSVSATAKVTTAGYTPVDDSFATGSSTSSNTATKYITAVTIPKDTAFSLTTTADTALDSTSNIAITNNAYRQLSITNNANGDTNISGAGRTDFTVGSTTTGTLYATGYIDNGTSTSSGSQAVITNGKWNYHSVTPSTSAQGPYYGETKVAAVTAAVAKSTLGSYTPSDTYFTTTDSGYGSITANKYSASTYYIKAGSATTPTASGASTSTSLSGTTLTVARSVTPSVSAGWVASGTAGTVTITGTVPTQTKSATPSTSSQTISPDSGKLLSSVTVDAVTTDVAKSTLGTVDIPDPTMGFSEGKVTASGNWTAGYTTDTSYSNSYTVTLDNAKTITGNASLNNAATTNVTYTENTADSTVIPANGYLYINAGYIGNTKISLGHFIPDDTNYTNAGTGQIRSGYEAYDTSGNKLIGTIADVTPSFTGGTPSLTSKSNTITTSMTTTTDTTDYYIDASASAKGYRTAVTYNGAATGYINVASGSSASAAATESSAETISATRIYVPKATASATAGSASATAGSTSVTGLTSGTYSTSTTSDYYIKATGGSASATGGSASVTVGYTDSDLSETGTSTGTKTGDSSTVYLVKGTITNNTSGGTSTDTINRGSQIKIGKGYYPADLYYTAQANSGTKTISSTGTISVDGYTNITTSGLQVIPTSTYTASGAVSSVDITSYGKLTIDSGTGVANTASLTADGYYSSNAISSTSDKITLTTTPTNGYYQLTASGSSKISTAGWMATGALTAATQKYYIAKGTITNNTTLPSGSTSSGTVNRGSYIKIASGYYPSTLYYLAQADAHSTSWSPSSTYYTTTNTGYGATTASAITPSSVYYIIKGTAGAISGGGLTHGAVTTSDTTYLTDTNTGYGITFSNVASRAAASYSITTAGWISSAGSGLSATGDDTKSLTKYIKAGSVDLSDTTLSVSPSVKPTATASASGNISLTATSSQPSSGYYVAATGGNSATTGSATSGETCTVTKKAGWIEAGTPTVSSTATASATANSTTKYYTVPTGAVTASGTAGDGSCSLNTSGTSGLNYSTSTNNSNCYIQFKGSGSVTPKYTVSTTGYLAANTTGNGTIVSSNSANSSKYYINGVTLTAPSSGTRTFAITVPNGTSSTITFTFSVDSSSNVTIS